MKKFILSSEEKEQLEYLHKKTKDVRESDRIRAILFRSEGWGISMIALVLRKHVYAWKFKIQVLCHLAFKNYLFL